MQTGTKEQDYKKCWEELIALFENHIEAKIFLGLWLKYINAIDDIIDEKIVDPKVLLNTFALASQMHSCKFYQTYCNMLWLTENLINDTYGTSVNWERAEEEWKKKHADTMRHCGIAMVFAVILIVHGREVMLQYSDRYKEFVYQDLKLETTTK